MEWVSSCNFPEDHKPVLILIDGVVRQGVYNAEDGYWFTQPEWSTLYEDPSHWMEIPTLPEEDE